MPCGAFARKPGFWCLDKEVYRLGRDADNCLCGRAEKSHTSGGKEGCRLSVVRSGFVHNGRKELDIVRCGCGSGDLADSHLSLVSRCPTSSQHAIFNTAGSKVIEYGVVRHDEHARVVFVWGVAVEDALAQEHGQ